MTHQLKKYAGRALSGCIIWLMCGGFGYRSFGETLVFPPYGHSYGIRKATPQHLFMFFGPRTFFDNPQGLAATRLDVWENPKSTKDDDEVTVYGVNCNRHQIIFNTSMWTLGLYGKQGSDTGCFFFPRGIAADRHGNVYVADSGNNRVVQLKNPKSSLEWVRAFSGKTATDAGLKGPTSIAIDEKCNVYATDPGNKRIMVFTPEGVVHHHISCSGIPTALAVADGDAHWSFFRDEQVLFYVDGSATVKKTTLAGMPLGSTQLPAGHTAAYGAIDYFHNYWITDTKNHVVIKYDHNLKLLDIFGSFGTKDNQFVEPRGIAVYKRYGQVFIAEKKGAQYYWVGTECTALSLAPNPEPRQYTLTVSVTEYSFVTLYSVLNGDTSFYAKRHRVPAGTALLTVGNKEQNLMQRNLTAKVEPTYSSYTYSSWLFTVPYKRDNQKE